MRTSGRLGTVRDRRIPSSVDGAGAPGGWNRMFAEDGDVHPRTASGTGRKFGPSGSPCVEKGPGGAPSSFSTPFAPKGPSDGEQGSGLPGRIHSSVLHPPGAEDSCLGAQQKRVDQGALTPGRLG